MYIRSEVEKQNRIKGRRCSKCVAKNLELFIMPLLQLSHMIGGNKTKQNKTSGCFIGAKEGLFQPCDSLLRKFDLLHIFNKAQMPFIVIRQQIISSSNENTELQSFSGIPCCLSLNVTRYLIIDANREDKSLYTAQKEKGTKK